MHHFSIWKRLPGHMNWELDYEGDTSHADAYCVVTILEYEGYMADVYCDNSHLYETS